MRKYGFNMQWMFEYKGLPAKQPDLKSLDFIAKRGFNFIRVPLDYNFWIKDFNYTQIDEKALEIIDVYLEACKSRGLHMCLNLHRAPGYCTNYNKRERDNLWTDTVAQDGFVYNWEYFASKYKGISSADLSFNLLNEPPNEGVYGLSRENHEAVMRRTINAIRKIDPQREIILDGVDGGRAIPELADTGTIQSGRGYEPFTISHYRAEWLDFEVKWEEPRYPCMLYGKEWNRDTLMEYYKPWKEVEESGVEVHMGEFGCYNKTHNDVALKWLADVLSVFHEMKWGYALWNFEGSYGIVNHGKPGAKYELVEGYQVDRKLLELLMDHMIWD